MKRVLPAVRDAGRPVLFVSIGWSETYNGKDPVLGTHGYLRDHADDCAEIAAFVRQPDGTHCCGIGAGQTPHGPFDVVFVARSDHAVRRRVVAVYFGAVVIPGHEGNKWRNVASRLVRLYPAGHRPPLPNELWRGKSGMRRWARRDAEEHPGLIAFFRRLLRRTVLVRREREEDAIEEGKARRALVRHYSRERSMRAAKIQSVAGPLRCEVPRCGFDFHERYGPLGAGYAHVHHLRPLREGRRKTRLEDLAIVCANCHAMIHRDGGCRALATLLPRRRRRP